MIKKNNSTMSFDDALDSVLSRMEKGESREKVIVDFPAHKDALNEALAVAEHFLNSNIAPPSKDALRSALDTHEETLKGAVLTSASGSFFSRPPFRMVFSLGAFALIALAFVWNGAERKESMVREDATTLSEGQEEISPVETKEIASLSEPIPKASGSADETVQALFSEMEQERVALGKEADAEILAAEEENNELNNYEYAEYEI